MKLYYSDNHSLVTNFVPSCITLGITYYFQTELYNL